MTDSTERFSSRVGNYEQYRPRYPQGVLATLQAECRLTPAATIADIGSGTGFLTELFLQNGNAVYAVEPNTGMRASAERRLGNYPGFRSIAGRAEDTVLPDASMDFIVSGQAFHWFDRARAREEFLRVLKPNGIVMIVWNERENRLGPFMAAYDALLERHVSDYYKQAGHREAYHVHMKDFFGANGFRTATFPYRQEFDFEGLKGRLLSSSYVPEPGHPGHGPMIEDLRKIFEAHRENGRVVYAYTTRMYFGPLNR